VEPLQHRLRVQPAHQRRGQGLLGVGPTSVLAVGLRQKAETCDSNDACAERLERGGARNGREPLTSRDVSPLHAPRGVLATLARQDGRSLFFSVSSGGGCGDGNPGVGGICALAPPATAGPSVPRRESPLIPTGDASVRGSGALWEFMLRWRLLAAALIAWCHRSASSVARGEPLGSPQCPWRRR
jgi:hypothetical protein